MDDEVDERFVITPGLRISDAARAVLERQYEAMRAGFDRRTAQNLAVMELLYPMPSESGDRRP